MTNGLFQLQYGVANFIFSLKYRQQKVDLSTGKKLLLFPTKRHGKFHLYAQLSYTKISYLPKNTHLRKGATFLHFRLKVSSENMIFPWNGKMRKLIKIWSFLSFSQIFVRRKFLFSCSVGNLDIKLNEKLLYHHSNYLINNCWIAPRNLPPSVITYVLLIQAQIDRNQTLTMRLIQEWENLEQPN